jgi:transcriptional regulator with XRE-family HTH domain
MLGAEISNIGKRIKEIRLSREQKLVDVAIKSGVSKGLLSRIENGRTIPSLPVLLDIISALGEKPGGFFESIDYSSGSLFYKLIKKNEYLPIDKEDSVGFNYYSIVSKSFSETTFNAVLLELEPHASRELVTTDGMEFIYLVSGTINYQLGNTTLLMEEGDSLFFDGRVPHLKINKSGETARILVIYLLFNK